MEITSTSFRDNIPRCTYVLKNAKQCTAYKKKGFETCGKHTPKIETSGSSGVDDKSELEDCPICYETISKNGLEYMLIGCKHYFHKECIKKWFVMKKDSCPSCRGVIGENEIKLVVGKRKRKVKTSVAGLTNATATATAANANANAAVPAIANARTFVLIGHTEEGTMYAWVDDDGNMDDVIMVV